jgi:hypothetical protein
MLAAADNFTAVRAALPKEGLFAEKDWLLSKLTLKQTAAGR